MLFVPQRKSMHEELVRSGKYHGAKFAVYTNPTKDDEARVSELHKKVYRNPNEEARLIVDHANKKVHLIGGAVEHDHVWGKLQAPDNATSGFITLHHNPHHVYLRPSHFSQNPTEDLEASNKLIRSHFGSGTKIVKKFSELQPDRIFREEYHFHSEHGGFYKNPTEEEWAKIPHGARGYVSSEGHLHVSTESGTKGLHHHLKQAIGGEATEEDPANHHGVTVERVGLHRAFGIGGSERFSNPELRGKMKAAHMDRIKSHLRLAKKHNPTVQFHLASHNELSEKFHEAGLGFFHNPSEEEWAKIPHGARGYVSKEGHLFMSAHGPSTTAGLHGSLLHSIRTSSIVEAPHDINYRLDHENHHGVSVQRVGPTRHMTVGESEAFFPHEGTRMEVEERRKSHFKAAKKNNPSVTFHIKGYEDSMVPESKRRAQQSTGINRLSSILEAKPDSKFLTNYRADTYQLAAKGMDSIISSPTNSEFDEWVQSFQSAGKRYGRWMLSESGMLYLWWGPMQWTRVQQEVFRMPGKYGEEEAGSIRAAGRYYNQSSKLEFESVLSHPVEMRRVADEVLRKFKNFDPETNIMLPFSQGVPVDVRYDAQIGPNHTLSNRVVRPGMV